MVQKLHSVKTNKHIPALKKIFVTLFHSDAKNSYSIDKGFINLIRELAEGEWLELRKELLDQQ
jgi:hypothetical protein